MASNRSEQSERERERSESGRTGTAERRTQPEPGGQRRAGPEETERRRKRAEYLRLKNLRRTLR